MVDYYFNENPTSGYGFPGHFDPFPHDFAAPVSQSLVLDSEKGELVKSQVRLGKKNVSEAKVIAALKSHSEAERRRRERINAHLDTLRGLVPCKEKMDKATLLAEVINQVKELKKATKEASKGLLIPLDTDEVSVEQCEDKEDGTFSFKASICSDYKPELLTDLRQALESLELKMTKAEISTLGGRMKNDFAFTCCRTVYSDAVKARRVVADSIQQALRSVLEKASAASPEYSPRTVFSNKRQRMSFFDSSSSSS